jgi:hypothetical protein
MNRLSIATVCTGARDPTGVESNVTGAYPVMLDVGWIFDPTLALNQEESSFPLPSERGQR